MLDVMKIDAETMKVAAGKWKGAMPTGIIPDGSGLLFGLEKGERPPLPGLKLSTEQPAAPAK